MSLRSVGLRAAFVASLICFTSGQLLAESVPPIEWIRQLGSQRSPSFSRVAIDGAGNGYVCGYTYVPVAGQQLTDEYGFNDGLVAKYSPEGELQWVRLFDGAGEVSSAADIAVASDGTSYIGVTSDILAMANTYTSLTSYDTQGQLILDQSIRHSYEQENFGGIALDSQENVYVSSNSGVWGTSTISKYTSTGQYQWEDLIGNDNPTVGMGAYIITYGIDTDETDHIYVTGNSNAFNEGDPIPPSHMFTRKYDSNGNLLWEADLYSPNGSLTGNEVDVSPNHGIYIGGTTYGDLEQPLNGSSDGFLTRYAADGTRLWTVQFGTDASEAVWTVVSDSLGNCYVGGSTDGDTAGVHKGSRDMFLIKFDQYGNEVWSMQMGTDGFDSINGLAIDGNGSIWVSGLAEGDMNDPNGTAGGAFLMKLVPEPSSMVALLTLTGVALTRGRYC